RERCIHCKRCVRYFEEVPGDEVLDFIDRGGKTYIATAEEYLPGNFTGNITDICPVGALLDATSRFRGRNWEYEHTRSTSPEDASGSAIQIDSRTGRIERIRAALNPDINKTWIDDGVRFGHEYTSAEDRLRTPLVRKDGVLEPASWSEAAEFIAQKLRTFGPGETGVAIRADSTLEEGVGARELAKQLNTEHLDHQPRPAASVLPEFRVKAATFTELATADAVLVIGDPTEEVPIVDLRIRDALKGVPPVDLLEHGVPIADLRLKEHMPLSHERLVVAAPYRTNLMNIAGTELAYEAGAEAGLLERLAGLVSGRQLEATDAEREAAAVLRGAEQPVIVWGSAVLADPEAARAARGLLRAAGAKPLIMGPAANSFGLELTGVLPGDPDMDLNGMTAGGLRGLIVSQLDPALSEETAARLKDMELVVLHTMFEGPGTEVADVVLPALSGLEKDGTFVNLEGRALPVHGAPTDAGEALDFCGVVRYLGE
ncbi:MAG TPA: molybdopterin-dependent oxidoreductase, partial [Deinococcales bacterium]|nr:molybdopterin-dependent oxidoreductase [Deinococcales bacterium]